MYKIMIHPGTFDPLHFHHWNGVEIFGRKYEMNRGILMPAYNHPEKNNVRNFDNRVEVMETFLEEMPFSFPVEVSRDEKITGSTGKSIIRECESREGDKYLFLGLDTVLEKLEKMEDYKKILEFCTLMVNDYDGEIIGIKGYPHETHIKSRSGEITLPLRKDRIIFDKNPFSGLHSTYIRENPEKYLYLFPEKTRELIKKYYIKKD
jgi:nicotinic acid mononucleotide adenylyltransferase